ncbi:MAG TPA: insulinase family protein [Planctomycetes bacterium]|nr:insulinase family protein [Planctomycetota bacterium]
MTALEVKKLLILLVLCFSPVVTADDLPIPSRPEELVFEELTFQPPNSADFRHLLDNGVVVFLLPDHELPLVDFSFRFTGGSYLDPTGKEGLGMLAGDLIRSGGSSSSDAESLDEAFDFLAANAGVSVGLNGSGASLNCLASNLEESFTLFIEMLRDPRFQTDRFDLLKSEIIEAMKQRNDSGDEILDREWKALIFGRDHAEAREQTLASIEGITDADLRWFHKTVFNPGNVVIGVTGDFEIDTMKTRLEEALDGWAAGNRCSAPPAPEAEFEPGVYHVEKDIPQGAIYIGARGVVRDHPDGTTLRVMNRILGGGGFTSRITNKVRTEEGLAYSAGSAMIPGVHYPGEFRAYVQSKSRTVALASKLILEEISRIREEPVTQEELDIAKNSIIGTFPRIFESKNTVRDLFVNEERYPRAPGFWKTYRDRVKVITPEDVQRVAREHLDPARMAIVIVGVWSEIAPGDLEGRAKMSDFFGGKVTELPLRDPLTQEPIGP